MKNVTLLGSQRAQRFCESRSGRSASSESINDSWSRVSHKEIQLSQILQISTYSKELGAHMNKRTKNLCCHRLNIADQQIDSFFFLPPVITRLTFIVTVSGLLSKNSVGLSDAFQ